MTHQVWEAMFMYAYANDKLGYVSDAEVLLGIFLAGA